jgi:hypothetical protein
VVLLDDRFGGINRAHQGEPFFVIGVEPGGDMALGD